MKVGVLAIQGNVREHKNHLVKVGAQPVEVRRPEHLQGIDGLIIPGGESTTIGMLMQEYGLVDAIKQQRDTIPLYGTCAGLILMARDVIGPSPARLGLMDIVADRNAFGRQVASFEAPLAISGFGPKVFPAVFIRAPKIAAVGPSVNVLAEWDGVPVMAEQGPWLVSSFHPEMSDDTRIHQYFVEKIDAAKKARGH